MDGDYLLDGLNQAQYDAVTATEGPIVVLAAAGSGKTRVLTRRIAYRIARGDMNPNRVVALTFTRRAAEELRRRQLKLGQRDRVLAGTFHGIALTQLRQRWAEQNKTAPKILDNKARVINQVAKELGIAKKSTTNSSNGSTSPFHRPSDVVAEIDWAQARLVSAVDYPNAAQLAMRTPPIDAEKMVALMEGYQREKRRRRVVDFDDLLVMAISSMRQDPTYAAAVRWKYNHLYVDEFQDINPLQFELLEEWRKDNNDLFVVGDPNQAIYGWNGADPQLLNRFTEREPEATVIHLTENYRSSPHVLKLARTAITKVESAPITNRTDGLIPTLTELDDDKAEARYIAETVRKVHSVGDKWADQAVLTRTNSQLQLISDALADAGIPARRRTGDGPLRNPAIRTELQAISKPGTDLVAWMEETQALLAEPRDGLPANVRTERSDLAGFVRLVDEYLNTDPAPSGPGLKSWVGVLNPDDVTSDEDSVDLLTFHGCKGLEWPIVHVAGLEDGFVPIAYAETGEQRSEEKRLLYVALTRAEDNLHLTWAAKREFKGRVSRRKLSPFVDPLEAAIEQCFSDQKQRPDWRTRLADSRDLLTEDTNGTTDSAEETLSEEDLDTKTAALVAKQRRDALATWRSDKARFVGVLPGAILEDSVLDALANQAVALAMSSSITTDGEFLDGIPGLSPIKRRLYEAELLNVLITGSARPS